MIKSKLLNIEPSIYAVISKMANDYDAIDLSQNYTDFNCNDELVSLVNKYMRKGYNQYAPIEGLFSLRDVIAEKTENLYSQKYNPEREITITAGATQAIYTAITIAVEEGDEVIVFEPAYETYIPVIKLNGGTPIYVQLKAPDFKIDWNEVNQRISSKTKMIIINSPNYHTGTTLSAFDIEKLQKIVLGTNILILSDEVFEHIIFDGLEHQSIARFPELVERSFIISSFGKTYNNPGWKIGYCLAPKELMKEFRKIHQFMMLSVNTPMQYALADYVKNKDEYLNLGTFYQKKRDYFNSLLKDSNFKIIPSKGTYFQLLDYGKISNEKEVYFAKKLIQQTGVASLPVSVFYHQSIENNTLRFCFAKSDETLEKVAEKLKQL